MDPSVLTGLLPLGGASVLLIYLLQIWLTERKSWQRERRMLYDLWQRERQDLTAAYRRETADREVDYQAHIQSLRARIRDLMADRAPTDAGRAYHDQTDLGEDEWTLLTLPPPVGEPKLKPRRDLRPIVLPLMVVFTVLGGISSTLWLNAQNNETSKRIERIEDGIGALADAINEIKVQYPALPIETPEQILEDAAVDVDLPEDAVRKARQVRQVRPGRKVRKAIRVHWVRLDRPARKAQRAPLARKGCRGRWVRLVRQAPLAS